MKVFSSIIDLFFPPSHDELIVRTCTKEMVDAIPPAADLPNDITARFAYSDLLARSLIWQVKYKRNKRAAHLLAEPFYEEIIDLLSEDVALAIDRHGAPSVLLVPIPLSRRRRRVRGYNQSELIGREIAKLDQEKTFRLASDVLIKNKDTHPQTSLGREDRLTNIKDCFTVPDPVAVRGKTIVLIDDVTTTGTTLREARKTLLIHKPRAVYCCAIAH